MVKTRHISIKGGLMSCKNAFSIHFSAVFSFELTSFGIIFGFPSTKADSDEYVDVVHGCYGDP